MDLRDGRQRRCLAVNLRSTHALRISLSPALPNVIAVLRSRAINPGAIVTEVAESMFHRANADMVRREVHLLSLGGFPVAYDDFGTRVASIIQFKALPVEVINRHTIIEGFRRRLRSSPAAPFEIRVCQATTGGP